MKRMGDPRETFDALASPRRSSSRSSCTTVARTASIPRSLATEPSQDGNTGSSALHNPLTRWAAINCRAASNFAA